MNRLLKKLLCINFRQNDTRRRKRVQKTKKIELDDFVKKLKEANVLHRRSGDLKVLHKGLDISGAGKRCLWIDNSTFEDIKLDNLPLDVPRSVH